jgi:hypothetical protein
MSLIVNNEESLLRVLADTGASRSIILEAYTSDPFIKMMTVVQSLAEKQVVNLIQLKLGYVSDIFIPNLQSQEKNVFFLGISS